MKDNSFRYNDIQINGPHCPFIEMEIISPNNNSLRVKVDAILDTGAAISCVPEEAILRLGDSNLTYGYITVIGATSEKRTIKKAYFNIVVANCSFENFPVAIISRKYALIGRDIINNYELRLNGIKRRWYVKSKSISINENNE